MKLSAIKVDSSVAEGEWIGNIPNMEDLELKVRAPFAATVRAYRNQLIRALPASVRNDPNGIPLEKQDEIEAELNLEVILLDWRNADMPYSKELARQYLTDPDWVDFREAVAWASSRVGRAQAKARDAEMGNLRLASTGR
jgi:hypothetical protein